MFSPVWRRSSSGSIRLCSHLYSVVVLLVVYNCCPQVPISELGPQDFDERQHAERTLEGNNVIFLSIDFVLLFIIFRLVNLLILIYVKYFLEFFS